MKARTMPIIAELENNWNLHCGEIASNGVVWKLESPTQRFLSYTTILRGKAMFTTTSQKLLETQPELYAIATQLIKRRIEDGTK